MHSIIFDLEVITPMFSGGANPAHAELRPASIKGLLRFWWRALEAEGDLEKLRNKEAEIFGSVAQGGKFAMQISNESLKASKAPFPNHPVRVEGKSFRINILEYLAYGTHEREKEKGNVFVREYILTGTSFKLTIKFSNREIENQVLKSFYVFSLFGGIGSRSRNGFGCFEVINKSQAFEPIAKEYDISAPYSRSNLTKLIRKVGPQSYSGFSDETKLFRSSQSFDTWDKALAHVGGVYRTGRLNLEARHRFEKRQYIGSPIIDPKVDKGIPRSFLERHAKPYFLKIGKEAMKYRSYILYLPSKYCDGLDKNKDNHPINHHDVDKNFENVCLEFNRFISGQMESVL